MAINPEYWRRARDEAPIHLQIRLETYADRQAEGPVVQIFRDTTGKLKVGDRLHFEVPVLTRPDPSSQPMPGRQSVGLEEVWLRAARFLEVYLESDLRDGYLVAWEQATALMRQTKEPVNPLGGESAYGVLVTDEVLERALTAEACVQTTTRHAIDCRSLTMRYGDLAAAQDLNFQVEPGEICVLLGANGAGKSTTLKMLTGLLKPTSGRVSVLGHQPAEVKSRIGVLPENLGLFEDLTIHEHLTLTADVYGLKRTVAEPRIDQLLRVLTLEHGRDTFARDCSHGMRKKTAFAMAVLHNPEVLFLDEPFEAIDPVSAKTMSDLLSDAARRGVTVLLTSHILSMVEPLGSRFLIMRHGRLELNAKRSELPRSLAELYFELAEAPSTERLEWLGSARS